MPLKQVRLHESTVDEIRSRGEKYGNTTDDVTLRLVFAELDRLRIENDYLKCVKEENERLKVRIKELEEKELEQ